jgi:hypothetical protein
MNVYTSLIKKFPDINVRKQMLDDYINNIQEA